MFEKGEVLLLTNIPLSIIGRNTSSVEGRFMRRREAGRIEGGAGEQALTSVAGARQFRAFAGAAPAGVLTHSTHPGGGGAPPGDTTIPCQELADGGAKSAAESAARRRKENAAAERREARRWAYPAGDLRRSGDRPIREDGHRVRRFRTSACRRSAPPL